MKVFELRFKNILIFLFLIFSTPIFSQENESQIKSINLSNGTEEIKLSNQNISWSKVIPGKQAKELSKIFNVSLDELTDNDIKNILVEKTSNTEKLAGLILKLIKLMVFLKIHQQ